MAGKKKASEHTKNMFMDLLIVDLHRERAWIFGYDGFLTMHVPQSMWNMVLDKVEKENN